VFLSMCFMMWACAILILNALLLVNGRL
jgi:hypothetical protein